MLDFKVLFGSVAVLVAILAYIPYFRDIFLGKTKPHAFSWLVWSVLTGIAFVGQILYKGGAGAWVTGFTAVVSFVIFMLAIFRGEKNITVSDKWSLGGAFAAMFLWYVTNSPLWSVILITVIDALAFYPTFRKSFYKPEEETVSTFFLSGLKFVFALVALEQYSVITYLYPLSLVLMNWVFVGMLVVRRKVV